jgi:excisionase family DNA binding protein
LCYSNTLEVIVTEALAEAAARLHGIKSAQERLSVSRSTIFELIGSGQLRSVLIGRRRLIPEQAIRDFIAQLDQQAEA